MSSLLFPSVAYAHTWSHFSGVGQGFTPSLLADWSFDPSIIVPLLLAVLYFKGLYVYRRRGGRRFPLWRAGMFLLGQVCVVLALVSPVDALSHVSFLFHMVQHELLDMLAVPLILLGAPFIPVVRGLPVRVRQAWFIPFARNRAVRWTVLFLTRPMVGFAAFVIVLWGWHLPFFYDAALENNVLHIFQHFSLVFASVLFWWHIVTPYPFPSRLHYLLRMLMLFGSALANTALASMITLADSALYDYRALHAFWGLSMLHEQQVGAGLMWVMGGMMRLAAITIVFIVYARQEEKKEPHYPLPLSSGAAGSPA